MISSANPNRLTAPQTEALRMIEEGYSQTVSLSNAPMIGRLHRAGLIEKLADREYRITDAGRVALSKAEKRGL